MEMPFIAYMEKGLGCEIQIIRTHKTCVEVELKKGKLVQLKVSPKHEEHRIHFPDWLEREH